MQHKNLFPAISAIGLLGAVLMLLAGCNSGIDLGNVTGRVTKNGQPQPKLLVNFSPGPGRRGSQGFTDADGRYELRYTLDKQGAVLGSQHVTITTENNPSKNLLSKDVDVTSGTNTIDFELADADGESANGKAK